MADQDQQGALVAAGVDPDLDGVDLDTVNVAGQAAGEHPEAYQPGRRSMRSQAPVSPAYDQQRTPWRESDRDLVY